MTTDSIKIDAAWKKAAVVIAALLFIPAAAMVLRWCVANSAVQRADDVELAVYLTSLAPDDPQTHHTAAIELEKSFDPADVEKALLEFEKAAALAPRNYMFWLDLGRARERSGDGQGAELALRRALELAPNYSRVQWALGNALLRQGRIDEAFVEIRKAVAGDPAYATPAAVTAWQFFEGDVGKIRRAMDGSSHFNVALAALLAREKRFDEAIEVWSTVPPGEKKTLLKETGRTLRDTLLAEKKFRDAVRVAADLGDGGERAGQFTNGGFESSVKPDGAGFFEWQIGHGMQPQIVLSAGQKHGGNNSLLLVFNATDAKDIRNVAQTIAVEPGTEYELELFYRTDLKTSANFKWEIVDAGTSKQIAVSEAMSPKAEWTQLVVKFRTPAQTDGIIVRLLREGCGQVCAITGNIWFDDFSLRTAGR